METTIIYDKPFRTIDELLELLESRNVVITDRDFAKQCILDISYYSLINSYKDLYPIDKDDIFKVPVPFYEFYNLGLGDPVQVSSVHGHGTGDLLDRVIEHLPEEDGREAVSSSVADGT